MLNYILHNLDRYPLDGVVHFELEIDYSFIHNVIDYMETECKRAGIQLLRSESRPAGQVGTRGLNRRPVRQEWGDGLPGKFNAGFADFLGVCEPQKAHLTCDHNIWCMSQFVYIQNTIYCCFRIDYPYILWYNANVLRRGATSKSPEHAPVAQLAEQLSCNQ